MAIKRSALHARWKRAQARRQAASRRIRLRCEQLERRVLLDSGGLLPLGPDGLPELPDPEPLPPLPPLEPGLISGRVWEDQNGNGQAETDEPGLGGVTVYSDLNFNRLLDADEPHAVTTFDDPNTDFDEGGFYSLEHLHPGFHNIRQVVPAGFEQTAPSLPPGYLPPVWEDPSVHIVFVGEGEKVEEIDFGNRRLEPGSVHGVKWEDINGNGVREDNEPGLAGVIIYSDQNMNGQFDDEEPFTLTMEDDPNTDFDEGGRYWLEGLDAGWHWIREVVPDGYQQTFPNYWPFDPLLGPPPADVIAPPPPEGGAHDVFIRPGEHVEGIDFGNQRVEPGSVHGIKWDDVNGNGIRESDELGVPGVIIYSDRNFNGIADPDEPQTITMEDDQSTDFDESGLYWLDGLVPGWHWIKEVVPDGFRQTFPLFGGPHDVFILPGQAIGDINFGNQQLRPSSIHGLKWNDENGNSERDPDEAGLPGVVIYSDRNLNGILDPDEPRTVTMEDDPNTDFDESGMYWLEGLDPGWHWIKEIAPEGFQQTFPLFNRPHDVFLLPGQSLDGIDFGNQRIAPASVHGLKWEDANGNGQREDDELGLPGVIIFSDRNLNGVFDPDEPHTVTMEDDQNTDFDESGLYWLEDLAPGWHWIKEVIPDGFRQTFPSFSLFAPPIEPVLGDELIAAPLPGGPAHDVFLLPGDAVDGLDFGNQRIVPGTIHGVKWEDLDGNGERNDDEPGLAGVTIYSDLNFNGIQDADEPSTVSMADDPATDFDEGGLYWLTVEPGFHVVREVVPDGYRQTFPHGPFPLPEPPLRDIVFFPPIDEGAHYVTVQPGQNVENIDFGNQPIRPGSIHGVKWEDANGNAEFDPWEQGLPGVTIYADLNHNGVLELNEPHTVTMEDDPDTDFDESGRYWLTGLAEGHYVIREVVPDGFEQTFPLLDPPWPLPEPPVGHPGDPVGPDGVIRPDGVADEFATVHPELLELELPAGDIFETEIAITVHPSLFVPIEIDVLPSNPDLPVINLSGPQPNGGSGDTSVFQIMVLGDGFEHKGELQFIDLAGGNAIASIPISINVRAPSDGAHRVTLRSGETLEHIDFGNRRIANGGVAGRKWLDRDGNGEQGPNEPGLAGVTIYVDHNQNGVFDLGEPSTVTAADIPETDFDEGGLYRLELPAGQHWIAEVVPDGFRQTFPNNPVPAIFPPPPGGGVHEVVLAPGQFVDDLNFGNQPVENGAVSGRKWVDLDGDGQRGPDEPGLAGVTVYADQNFNGQLDFGEPRAVTIADNPLTDFDETGQYRFQTRPGFQAIRELVPPGYRQTFPISDALSPLEQGAHFVNVEPGEEITELDFGNQPFDVEPAGVSGLKWHDLNFNGRRDADEPGLAGVTIYSDLNFDGVFSPDEPHTVTTADIPETDFDEGGLYSLSDLAPGLHVIREVLPPGFIQTFPSPLPAIPNADGHTVVLAAGSHIDGLNFGNAALDLPIPLPGDFNHDGVADGSDLRVWSQSYGTADSEPANASGGHMTGGSFLEWQRNLSPRLDVAALATSEPGAALQPVNLDGSPVGSSRGRFAPGRRSELAAVETAFTDSDDFRWQRPTLQQRPLARRSSFPALPDSRDAAEEPTSTRDESWQNEAVDAALAQAFG